jgi:hypothetical protein
LRGAYDLQFRRLSDHGELLCSLVLQERTRRGEVPERQLRLRLRRLLRDRQQLDI